MTDIEPSSEHVQMHVQMHKRIQGKGCIGRGGG